jgi:hypothetical protein
MTYKRNSKALRLEYRNIITIRNDKSSVMALREDVLYTTKRTLFVKSDNAAATSA